MDLTKISDVAIMTIEGANDDISAPGQCVAAIDLCTGVPANKKMRHLEPGAGHYGIFGGKSWRLNIRPIVLDFIDDNSGDENPAPRRRRPEGNGEASAIPGINSSRMPV